MTRSGVTVPPELADRPVDPRDGRVIAWTTAIDDDDGLPMQGVNIGARCAQSILDRLCGQCGRALDYWIVFIGDDECVTSRCFLEPPMHEACARYAVAACPYLASERYVGRVDRPGVQTIASRERPKRMAMYWTRDYKPDFGADAPMAAAAPAKRLEWF